MKKVFMALCALCLAFTAQAQETSQETAQTQETKQKTTTFDGAILEYDAIDGGLGVGLGLHGKHIEWSLQGLFGDTNDYLTDNSAFRVSVGGNYAYWFTNTFYIEGSAGLFGNYATWKYKGEDEENKFTLGFYVSPRIGLNLFTLKNGSAIGVTASYRWDFNKFKTDSANKADYFTIGLTYGL